MGVEIGNVSFSLRPGDRVKVGKDIDLLAYAKTGGGRGVQFKVMIQAPKDMKVRLIKRVVKAAQSFQVTSDD